MTLVSDEAQATDRADVRQLAVWLASELARGATRIELHDRSARVVDPSKAGERDARVFEMLDAGKGLREIGITRFALAVCGRIVVMDPREAQLLGLIRAAPDDDAPRLVYADLLLERGDPRGELLQLQCGPARLGRTTDPGVLQLLQRHGAAWLGPLASVLTPTDCEFTRGFLSRIRFPTIEALLAGAPLLPVQIPIILEPPDVRITKGDMPVTFAPDGRRLVITRAEITFSSTRTTGGVTHIGVYDIATRMRLLTLRRDWDEERAADGLRIRANGAPVTAVLLVDGRLSLRNEYSGGQEIIDVPNVGHPAERPDQFGETSAEADARQDARLEWEMRERGRQAMEAIREMNTDRRTDEERERGRREDDEYGDAGGSGGD